MLQDTSLSPAPMDEGSAARGFDAAAQAWTDARAEIERVVIGQPEVVEQVLVTLLAGGHGLLVGVPGLAKTTLVKTIGTVLGLDARRVQFTPDLMPADILGSEVLDIDPASGARAFRFVPGPVFCQLLLADEINRASPRTQSALLEAMQEAQVSVAGHARAMPRPFHVLATQNPIEQEGTYPLPEAQLDRFLLDIRIDYPDRDAERAVLLATTGAQSPVATPRLDATALIDGQALVRRLPMPAQLVERVLDCVRRLRPGPDAPNLLWGPGPRAGQALLLTMRARALLHGRPAPTVDDLAALLAPVLRHRLQLAYTARAEGQTIEGVIRGVVDSLD
jgi:MoxR-like ATPase